MSDGATPPKSELEVRAAAGTLTYQDQQLITRARALRAGMKRGLTVVEIAKKLGDVSRTQLARFMGSEGYKAALRVAGDAPDADEPVSEEEAVERARKALANGLPKAIEFIEHAFDRDDAKPERPYKDEGLAQWATALLLKSSGIGDPNNSASKPAVVITAEAMQVMLGAIKGDDSQREQRAALPLPSVTVTVDKKTTH